MSLYADDEESYNVNEEKCLQIKYSFKFPYYVWTDIYQTNIKVNDYIYVSYIPDSQRYLYTHFSEIGIVTKIVDGDIFIKNQNNEEVSIHKDHLSMYSSGYSLYITKLVNNTQDTLVN